MPENACREGGTGQSTAKGREEKARAAAEKLELKLLHNEKPGRDRGRLPKRVKLDQLHDEICDGADIHARPALPRELPLPKPPL